jgi:nucleotide-sensitive chloride channel 1A
LYKLKSLIVIPVEAIFEALSHCAALHPDPADPDDIDGDDDAFISTEADFDEQELSEAGRVRRDPSSNHRHAPY